MTDFQLKSGHFGHYVRRLYYLNILFGLASVTALEDKVLEVGVGNPSLASTTRVLG